jgi:hypothetical protein
MARQAGLFVVVGQKASGKSTTTLNLYIRPSIRSAASRRSLIVDPHEEYAEYPDIKTLPIDKIQLFSIHPIVEIRRIQTYYKGQEMTPDQKAECVKHILNNYRNGILLLEDINEYIFDYMPGDIVGQILSQRHKGIDIILHYHSLGAIHKKIWRHINVIRMHKCEDSVMDNRDKFPEKFELFKIAENIVNDQFSNGNQYFYLHIDMPMRQIIADISEQDKEAAVNLYIQTFHNRLLTPYLNQRNAQNMKLYTHPRAWEEVHKRLMATYFKA